MDQSIVALLILCGLVILYATPFVPIGVTSVLGAIAMAATGIISPAQALAGFGSDTLMMVAGMVIVGLTIHETGLAHILVRSLLKIKFIRESERLFLGSILLVVCVVSAFLSNTATVALFLPLVASVAGASGGKITKKNTFMAVGIGAVVSGNLTLISSTPQLVAQGILMQTEGVEPLRFFDITRGALPAIAMLFVYYLTFGYKLQKKVFNFEEKPDPPATAEEGGPVAGKSKMIISGLIFALCVAGMITGVLTMGLVALLSASACIVTRCIPFKYAMQKMDWTAILVLGGALGYARGLIQSGAIDLIIRHALEMLGHFNAGPYAILIVLMVMNLILGNVLSNTASTAIFLPIALGIAAAVEANPLMFTVGIIISSNTDFAAPMCTPPITMTLSGGYRFADYTKVGGLFGILALVVTIIFLPILYP